VNVLSLFDGMSCGQLALNKANIQYDNYFASEIKRHAIETTQHNYPKTIQLGDVHNVYGSQLPNIDLLIGGSPCQNLTYMNSQGREGLKGEKSKLFYEYVRLLKEIKPKYFLLENVGSMKIKDREVITNILGVKPIKFNSKLVSAQNRNRLYWTNIPFKGLPKDRGILLDDIVDRNAPREENWSEKKQAFVLRKNKTMYVNIDGDKSIPITARGYSSWNTQFITNNDGMLRDLTLEEYKKLQSIPSSYEFNCIKSKATNLIGDGWTIDVISYIFEGIVI
jgi:site-specific DNA-cytosine methylase